MKLFSLIKNINCRTFGTTNLSITGIYHHDTEVKENGLFFCLRGTRVDGNNYIFSAIKNGAVAIVTEQEIPNLKNITQVVVKNARESMSLIACQFFGNPANKLKIVGVTGTNGKTSISTMLFSVLSNMNKKVALIGTNGIIIDKQKYESKLTTPDPIDLQRFFSIMVKKHIEYVFMEVSAHAIDLFKIEGFRFEQIIWTNLTEDHLDYFKTMDNYFKTKLKIFNAKYTKNAIINIDDPYGKEIIKSIKIPFITYSINEDNNKSITNSIQNIIAKNITQKNYKYSYQLENDVLINLQLSGKFNISNSLATIASLKLFGFSDLIISNQIEKIQPIEGRFNIYNIDGVIVVIDFAHTPDGLYNALETCKEIALNNKIICVFGCGGNRDKEKRKIMGKIASNSANFSIITSDNPRFESEEDIAKDIESGFEKNNYKIVLDRTTAIKNAISISKCGDLVLIAGKGAEKYIDKRGEQIPYSDYDVIKNISKTLKWKLW